MVEDRNRREVLVDPDPSSKGLDHNRRDPLEDRADLRCLPDPCSVEGDPEVRVGRREGRWDHGTVAETKKVI